MGRASDRLARNTQATVGQEFLDVAVAECNAKIKPDGVADDVGREPAGWRRRPASFQTQSPLSAAISATATGPGWDTRAMIAAAFVLAVGLREKRKPPQRAAQVGEEVLRRSGDGHDEVLGVDLLAGAHEEIPAEFYALWRGVVIGLIGLLVSGVVEFLREYSGQRVLGNEKKIVLTYVACLSAMGFAFNDAVASMVSMFGIGFLLTYCFCSLLWMLAKGSLLRSKIGILYFVSFLITDTMFFRDFMLLPGNAAMFDGVKRMINMPPFLQEEIYFSPSALMLLLFSMMAVVIQRYQAAREYEEAEAVRIYGALAQSEAELRTVLGQQHAVESAQVAQSERQRLLLEIHDGIGMQLAEGYRRASEGKLTSEQFADVFQICIDDMRLIMDCISMRPRADMEVILGSLLHRLQPRLAKSGIEVDYRPFKRQQAHLGLSDVQCLHAGRIVQECLIAAMQHKACNRVVLVLRESAQGILIYIHDNGAPVAGQYGAVRLAQQAELRKRAASLGSNIRFHHGHHGHATALLYRFKERR